MSGNKAEFENIVNRYDDWAYENFELGEYGSLLELLTLRESIHRSAADQQLNDEDIRLIKALDEQLKETHGRKGQAGAFSNLPDREQYEKTHWWWLDELESLTPEQRDTV